MPMDGHHSSACRSFDEDSVPNDITDRLWRLLEETDMGSTQTEFMKSKKERSRDQAKDRKTLKQSLNASKGESAHMCIGGYGEFDCGDSSSNEHSQVHDSHAYAAVEELDNQDSDEELGSGGHIYVDDPYKQWRQCATAFRAKHFDEPLEKEGSDNHGHG